jgi:hypothetical protein
LPRTIARWPTSARTRCISSCLDWRTPRPSRESRASMGQACSSTIPWRSYRRRGLPRAPAAIAVARRLAQQPGHPGGPLGTLVASAARAADGWTRNGRQRNTPSAAAMRSGPIVGWSWTATCMRPSKCPCSPAGLRRVETSVEQTALAWASAAGPRTQDLTTTCGVAISGEVLENGEHGTARI